MNKYLIPTPSDFSFTLTIPAHKMVTYYAKRIKYCYLTNKQQYILLEDVLAKLFFHDDEVNWVYERHSDGRLHIHGFVKNTYYDYLYQNIKKFYSDYRINIGPRTFNKIMDIQETYNDLNYWHNYIQKHQHEIVYKSRFLDEQANIQAIENGVDNKPQVVSFFKLDDNGLPLIENYPFGRVKIVSDKKLNIVEL